MSMPLEIRNVLKTTEITPEQWVTVVSHFGNDALKALMYRMFYMHGIDAEVRAFGDRLETSDYLYGEYTVRAQAFVAAIAEDGQEIGNAYKAAVALGTLNRADTPRLRQEASKNNAS